MNSKKTFFTLVMAIVMMVMCPSELWAADADKPWLCFTAKTGNYVVIELKKIGLPSVLPSIEYSIDEGATWTKLIISEQNTLHSKKVYFRAGGTSGKNETFSESVDNYFKFVLSNECYASGNVMSLLDASCKQTNVPAHAFRKLFYKSENLLSAPELPATKIGVSGYRSMFYGCTKLTEAPVLPATALANYCYSSMFYNCTGLISPPELPDRTIMANCYSYMFKGCTNLVVAPKLHATKIAKNCYTDMFSGCTKLNEVVLTGTNDYTAVTDATTGWLTDVAPNGVIVLPEGQSTDGINIPEGWEVKTIPANYAETQTPLCFTATSSSQIGFKIYGTLTSTPSLDYSTDNATWTPYTFGNTISLAAGRKVYFRAGGKYGKNATFSESISKYIYSISTGKFSVSGNIMSLLDSQCMRFGLPESAFTSLFKSNTALTTAPELPSTILNTKCYYSMFKGCTGLTTAPVLPATTMFSDCYYSMFYGCKSLKRIVANFTSWTGETTYWLNGVSSTGTFVCPEGLAETRGISNIPKGWKIARISHPSVTLNAAGFATYSADVNTDVLTDGVKVYTAAVSGTTITLKEIEDKCIPAGVGVVLYGKDMAGTQVDFGLSLRTPTASANALSATTNANGELVGKSASGYTFVMNKTDNLFHPYTGTEFAANRAFLHLNTNPVASGAKGMSIMFDGDITTSIGQITPLGEKEGALKLIENGRIVIIKNGKKFNTNGQEVK